MLIEFVLLAVAFSAMLYSVVALLRAHRPKPPVPRDTALHHDRATAMNEYLARRGLRYFWYLLAVSTFFAVLIVRNLIRHHGH